jgi:phospholipid/cholesterol/gamma-HCH transport system permease protein
MHAESPSVAAVTVEVQDEPGGRVVVSLRGPLNVQSTGDCWRELEARLKGRSITVLEVDASRLKLEGMIGSALLRYLEHGGMTPAAQVRLRGLSKEDQVILNTFAAEDVRDYRPPVPAKPSLPVEVGEYTRSLGRHVQDQIAFIGSLFAAVPSVLAHPKHLRWEEIRRVAESAGANAVPVVGIVSALIGMVTALEAAHPLAKFGAQIFIADMIGFSSIRDTGPLITAILLAGRSGSAFAAELGTMKVNQELDALATMGLSPMRFLVVQRVLAAVLLTPLLTLYAMLMTLIGGVVFMRFLGFPPLMILHQIEGRVGVGDLEVGLTKALLFGLIVGGVGCMHGLQTGRDARAVGTSTTGSVVAGILLVILADTLYSAVQYFVT